jgi:hypothetical protein
VLTALLEIFAKLRCMSHAQIDPRPPRIEFVAVFRASVADQAVIYLYG